LIEEAGWTTVQPAERVTIGSYATTAGWCRVTRIFLSYGRNDDEPFVARLHSALIERGFSVWWDRRDMPSRALTFLQEIRDAVDECDRLVAVVGPAAVQTDYVTAEWQYALVRDKVVVPVLRIGTHELLPADLRVFHCPDVRPSRDWNDGLAELVRILNQPLPELGEIHSVPPPPPRFQPRPLEFSRLSLAVLPDEVEATVVSNSDRITLLHGMGGVGKSVLAAAFARSTGARKHFVDGVFWMNIRRAESQESGCVSALSSLSSERPIELTQEWLARAMAQKRALIVLDNVDNARDIEAFVMALGTSPCRLLITSRDGALATTLGVAKRRDLSLDVLPLEAALRQLADWTNNGVNMLPPVAHEVAAACGRLPFALSLCGAFAADGLSWADIAETLRQTDLDFLERTFPDYPYPSILRSLNASMEILERQDPLAARCFRQLAVFYKGDAIPEKAVTMLWMHSEKLEGRRVRKLLVQLERKSLLRVDGDEPFRRISLHDLQHDYLTQLVFDIPALHDTLLAAYRSQCGDTGEWRAGPDDDYFLQRVAYHLAAAEKIDDLRHLLFDVRWIERRLAATDPISTITDYNFLPDNPQAAALKDALRLSIPVLWRNPGQLRGQLAGRLPPGLLPGILGPTDRLELRPVSASLARDMIPSCVWHRAES
jgi:hypothetical protein